MAKVLWFFDMSSPGDAPVDADIQTAFTDGFLTAPKQFPVHFQPRSEQRAAVLQRGFQDADAFLSQDDQKISD